MRKVLLSVLGTLLLSGALHAADKNMMHCFAFTPIEKATPAEWDAWYKANDALPKKMKGIVKKVWYGKLTATLAQYAVPADARKKLQAGEKSVTAPVEYRPRQWGMCMEMNGLDKLKAYTEHPYHKEWVAVYEKVRVAGTTTYDILGQ